MPFIAAVMGMTAKEVIEALAGGQILERAEGVTVGGGDAEAVDFALKDHAGGRGRVETKEFLTNRAGEVITVTKDIMHPQTAKPGEHLQAGEIAAMDEGINIFALDDSER